MSPAFVNVSSFCVNVHRCLVASLFEVRVTSLRRVYRGMSKKGLDERKENRRDSQVECKE